ncbi:protein phosphatase 2C domain-containing protein [Rugamonas sp.]|uniref:PP2C family protein-serine/threonine phosphatase n=1 Tax=Rugamonas sp. TaxID=1926287 RepID=UPI0025E849C5|nr:protein phosphatase 2C domain-containing protein [Rugamonas sp.]
MSAWTPLSGGRPHRLSLGVALGATDVGPVRDSNEDNFLIDESLGLAMVADGMGGHAAGEVASAGALQALCDYLHRHADAAMRQHGSDDADATWSDPTMRAVGLLYDAIDFANHGLYAQNLARNCPEGGGMGTTLCGFWHPPGDAALVLFNVGDSRLYRQRDGRLEQLTRDQTLYQQALEAGVIDHLPARNLLLQAVGPSPHITPEVRSQLPLPGDVLMLCSDGLHGAVPHGEIEQVLAGATAATLDAACARLIALAKQYGGRDNITVLLTWCDPFQTLQGG